MSIQNPNAGDYDFNLGIESDIINYIKESHIVESRVSPTRCYLIQQNPTGSVVGEGVNKDPIEITSYIETSPNYKTVIWASGSLHPDLRPYTNDGLGSVDVFIDSNRANRILDVEDLLNNNEFVVQKRYDLDPQRVELVFNKNWDASAHTITYKYTTLDQGISTERVKQGEAKDTQQTLFGWSQYLNSNPDDFRQPHQILVRTPLTTNNVIINAEGRVELEDNQCWMIWEPYVKDFDLLIVPLSESPNERELRFQIENKQDSRIQGQLVSQRFQIKLLEESDSRYQINYVTV